MQNRDLIRSASAVKPQSRITWTLVALGVLFQCVVLAPALMWSFAPNAPLNDFVSFYSGGALAGDPALYDPDTMQAFQQRLGVSADQHRMAFIRPPFYAVLLSPIAALPYRHAYVLWQILACISFITIGWLWVRLLNSAAPALVLAWSLPVGYSLLRGQDTHVFLLFYSIAVLLFMRGRHFAAGAMLSLALLKWIFLLCLPLLIIRRRMWRLAAGFCTAAAALVVVSTLSQGSHWPELYAQAVLRPSASPNVFAMPTVRGLVHALEIATALEVVLAAVVLWRFWSYLGAGDRTESVWATQLLAGLLVGHHAYMYDAANVIPSVAAALVHKSALIRLPAVALILPFLWGALLFPGWAYVTQSTLLFLFFTCTPPGSSASVARRASHIA